MTQQYSDSAAESVDLSHLDEQYSETEVEEQDFEPVPDGKYQVTVEAVELTHAQSSGNPMLKWKLRILGPAFRNRILWRNSVITSNTLQYLKKDLLLCGLQLAKLSELNRHLGELLDVKLEVNKRTKGDSENVFFNRRITVDGDREYDRAAGEAMAPF